MGEVYNSHRIPTQVWMTVVSTVVDRAERDQTTVRCKQCDSSCDWFGRPWLGRVCKGGIFQRRLVEANDVPIISEMSSL